MNARDYENIVQKQVHARTLCPSAWRHSQTLVPSCLERHTHIAHLPPIFSHPKALVITAYHSKQEGSKFSTKNPTASRSNAKVGFTTDRGINMYAELSNEQDVEVGAMVCEHGLNGVAIHAKEGDIMEERSKAATGDIAKPIKTKKVSFTPLMKVRLGVASAPTSC